jgi:hypothetical protein
MVVSAHSSGLMNASPGNLPIEQRHFVYEVFV